MHLMDDHLLFEVFNNSTYAIVIMNTHFKVTFWNKKAESLFDLKKEEMIGEINPLSLDESISESDFSVIKEKGTFKISEIMLPTQKTPIKITGYLTGINTPAGELGGLAVFIKLDNIDSNNAVKKRTFDNLRFLILATLMNRRKTINQIAKDISVNWKTVENHLTYLLGKKKISEIFSSKYVRIFEISDKGKQHVKENISKQDIIPIKHFLETDNLLVSELKEKSNTIDYLKISREVGK